MKTLKLGTMAAALVFSIFCTCKAAPAQGASVASGVYEGSYQCSNGSVKMKLAMVTSEDGSARGRLTFAQPDKMGGASGSFNLKGNYDAATGKFKLEPLNWNPPVPPGVAMLGVEGTFDARTKEIKGNMTGGCGTFRAARNEQESAALPKPPGAPKVGPAAAATSNSPQN